MKYNILVQFKNGCESTTKLEIEEVIDIMRSELLKMKKHTTISFEIDTFET